MQLALCGKASIRELLGDAALSDAEVVSWADQIRRERRATAPWHYVNIPVLALAGLRKGRSAARETEKVRPVPDAQVEAVLPLLSPQVVAMIELQRLTGARSGELCRLRTCDVDTSDDRMWVYRPPHHKTAHHDQVREIFLGPKARRILEPFLEPDLQAFVFSPAEAAEWHRERRRHGRTLTPSQAARSRHAQGQAHKRKRAPGEWYTRGTTARRA